MPRNKRVFPFFLDGGKQTVGSLNASWDGTSSFVEVTATEAGTLSVGITDSYGRPIPHGTMLVVKKLSDNYNQLTIDPSADFTTNDHTTILLSTNSMALFMFKGPSTTNDKGEWVELMKVTGEPNKKLSDITVGGVAIFENQTRLQNDGTTTAATGNNAGNAATITPIDHPVYLVSSDGATKGIRLAAQPPNDATIVLINTSGTALKLYPDGSTRTTINGAASIDLAANSMTRVYFTAGAVYVG